MTVSMPSRSCTEANCTLPSGSVRCSLLGSTPAPALIVVLLLLLLEAVLELLLCEGSSLLTDLPTSAMTCTSPLCRRRPTTRRQPPLEAACSICIDTHC